MKYDLFTSR